MIESINGLQVLAGALVGLLVGVTGVGGGSLMTPILVLMLGVAPVVAVGTDLWFAAITKLFGVAVHGRQGRVDWEVFRRLSMGSLPAAVLTLAWMHWGGQSKVSGGFLINMVSVVLALTAIAMLMNKQFHAVGLKLRSQAPEQFKRVQAPLTLLAGMILGVLVTLTSIGAGALGAVMLLYLYPRRMNPHTIVGTDLAHAIPLTIVAGLGHLWLGNVNGVLLFSLLLGSVPAIILSSLVATRLPAGAIRVAIAVVLMAVSAKMLLA